MRSLFSSLLFDWLGGANMPNASRAGSALSMGQQQSTSRHSNNAIAGGATQNVQPLSLLDMPYEILDTIFSYAGYKEVSNARLVSVNMFNAHIVFSILF